MNYVGWDLGRRYSYLTVMDASGAILQREKTETTAEALKDFFQALGPETRGRVGSCWNWYGCV